MSTLRVRARSLRGFSNYLSERGPNGADAIASVLLAGALAFGLSGIVDVAAPLSRLSSAPVSLDPALLPGYALRTTVRMFAALAASTLFTLFTGTLAARSRRAEQVIVPALDILQSVPILGFLTFTVTFFLRLFPGEQLGAECAAVFAIFTSQAWNMAFSFYQSLRSVPTDLEEVAQGFGLSPMRRFLRLELPFAVPGLVWNAMMSMSGGWFFIVASEAITVGNTTVALPGIGSWLALAIGRGDMHAVALAVGAMIVVILLYDQLFFRPIVAWADKFRFEQTASATRPASWVYDIFRRTRLLPRLLAPVQQIGAFLLRFEPRGTGRGKAEGPIAANNRALGEWVWRIMLAALVIVAAWEIVAYVGRTLSWHETLEAVRLACYTLLRVIVLIALATVIWVPIGVWVGLRPRWAERLQPLAQFLAAFPANVLFPFAVMAIVNWRLSPDIWLSVLMILGTQWYILFNVIAGASVIPTDMREAASIFGLRGWRWWRRVAIPAIFPYYVTGALTASGGSWNASIVAEAVSWGHVQLRAAGLGSYIADATAAGDYPRVALGVAVMSAFVLIFNRLVWRPMYAYADRRLRLG